MNLKFFIPLLCVCVGSLFSLMVFKESVVWIGIPLALIGGFVYFMYPSKEKGWVMLALFLFVGSGRGGRTEEFFAIIAFSYAFFNFGAIFNAMKHLWKINILVASYYLGLIVLSLPTFQLEAFKFHLIYLLLLHVFVGMKLKLSVIMDKVVVLLHFLWVASAFLEMAIDFSSRLGGPMGKPTIFGAVLIQSWSLMLGRWTVRGWGFGRIVLFSLPGLVAILGTGTRSCLLVAMCTYVFVIFYKEERRKWIRHLFKMSLTKGMAILVVMLIFLFSPFGAGVLERIANASANEGVDLSTLGRFAAWYVASQIFIESPFFGVGQNQFQQAMHETFPPNLFPLESVFGLVHAHNAFFSLLAETGLWGVLHVVVLLYIAFRGIGKQVGFRFPLYMTLFATLVLGVFDTIPFHDINIFMGIFLLSLYLFHKDKIGNKQEV